MRFLQHLKLHGFVRVISPAQSLQDLVDELRPVRSEQSDVVARCVIQIGLELQQEGHFGRDGLVEVRSLQQPVGDHLLVVTLRQSVHQRFGLRFHEADRVLVEGVELQGHGGLQKGVVVVQAEGLACHSGEGFVA